MIKRNEMRYMEFLSPLRRNKVSTFSLRYIENMFPDANVATMKNNLTSWLKKGYIERLKRDLYACVEPALESEIPDFYVANKLYTPSYISLETALSLYNIIPEIAAQVTSVTTKPGREFKKPFLFREDDIELILKAPLYAKKFLSDIYSGDEAWKI